MSGGLVSLLAVGIQDAFLTGNPQVTFFKQVFRRYTNFSSESVPQYFGGLPDFGRKASCTISRVGDLLHRVHLQVTLPQLVCSNNPTTTSKVRWVDKIGHAMIKYYALEIGGREIDRHYGEFLEIWNSLTLSGEKLNGYDRMIGHVSSLHLVPSNATPPPYTNVPPAYTLFIPFQFWFCRNPGLALPLVALQYNDVRISVEFRPLSELIIAQSSFDVWEGSLIDPVIYADMIYLEPDERRRFATARHEYLIDTCQFNGSEVVTNTRSAIPMNFSHPVKFLTFVVQKSEYSNPTVNQLFNFCELAQPRSWTDVTASYSQNIENWDVVSEGPIDTAKLVINGQDRFRERVGPYFNLMQAYQCFPCIPTSPGIYTYSFALRPTESQPSGATNFSRLDTAVLDCTFRVNLFFDTAGNTVMANVRIYACSVNVLKVAQGLAALAYSV